MSGVKAILRCKSPYVSRTKDSKRVIGAGELVREDDPCVKGNEHRFEAVETYVDRMENARKARPRRRQEPAPVEQATAAPGEKRATPTKRTTTKKG